MNKKLSKTFEEQIAFYVNAGTDQLHIKKSSVIRYMFLITCFALSFLVPLGGYWTFYKATHSGWMVYWVIAFFLDIWGTYLCIKKYIFAAILYEGVSGMFISAEWLGLGIIMGIYVIGMPIWILCLFLMPAILLVAFISNSKMRWYRTILDGHIEHENEKKVKYIKLKRILIWTVLILFILFVLVCVLIPMPTNIENVFFCIACFLIGYVFSMSITYLFQYYVAKRHKDILPLDE